MGPRLCICAYRCARRCVRRQRSTDRRPFSRRIKGRAELVHRTGRQNSAKPRGRCDAHLLSSGGVRVWRCHFDRLWWSNYWSRAAMSQCCGGARLLFCGRPTTCICGRGSLALRFHGHYFDDGELDEDPRPSPPHLLPLPPLLVLPLLPPLLPLQNVRSPFPPLLQGTWHVGASRR